jgi:hypothetical protein
VLALKISFGMHFGKSPQHEAPRWGHSFHPSTPIANMATFPQRSAFSCSSTIAPSPRGLPDSGLIYFIGGSRPVREEERLIVIVLVVVAVISAACFTVAFFLH